MTVSFSMMIGAALIGLLAVFVVKGVITARSLQKEPEDTLEEPSNLGGCPPEVVDKIFSERDREFIRRFKSRELENYFEAERRTVAVLWVRQTASGIRKIMREHTAAARRSASLQPLTELRLFVQYSELMLICGILLMAMPLIGPLGVRGLAGHAQRLSQGIAEAQTAFAAAMDSRTAGLQRL